MADISTILALAGRFTQDTRLIRLATPLGVDLLPECVHGTEAISEGYAFRIDALCMDAYVGLRGLVGQPVLLQWQTQDGTWRPIHGHVTAAHASGANGGFARYVLVVEPWTSFLAKGRDSRTFQGMDVFQVLDAVFRGYDHRGRLAPAWRYDVADRSLYPRRSLVTQYQESDLAFAARLMHEEGLFYFFEHEGVPDGAALGRHTLVVADHPGAFRPNVQATVDFSQPGAVMPRDSIDRWCCDLRCVPNVVEIRSWDYRTVGQRHAATWGDEAGAGVLASRDAPGAYAFGSTEHGRRIADRQIEAFEARRQTFAGAGTVRTFAPATTFTLHGHAIHDAARDAAGRSFAIVRVEHLMHNNLHADMVDGIGGLLGQGSVALDGATAFATRAGERPLYRNRIDAIPSGLRYRHADADGHGRLLHPKPTVHGVQTAIVVGPPGVAVYTDRDHRIKIQFHWQRGAVSHSRLDHPVPEAGSGAPGNDAAGTWVRVATPLAGANWGAVLVPRVGQEVLVMFMEGDIDRPVVVGALYNGRGAKDAQHNHSAFGPGRIRGSAPAWFAGERDGHAHAAIFSGIRSQALASSQDGRGAGSQLVFDDSPGQCRSALQHHVQPNDGCAELNLGHLRHQAGNQRLDQVGAGAELASIHGVALRGAQGLLLSSDARTAATGTQLDAREAIAQIESSHRLQRDLAHRAQQHHARLEGEQEADQLPAVRQLAHAARVLAAADADGVAAYLEPQLQLSSPAGVVVTTPASAFFHAEATASCIAGQDIDFVAQGASLASVAHGISLFTDGKAPDKDRPNQETGIRLHAASGKVSVQSQSGATRLVADKTVTVASVQQSVTVAAPNKHVLLTAQGAFLKLEGGNISLHGPGKIVFRAGLKELGGPLNVPTPEIASKLHELKMIGDLDIEYVDADGNPLKDEPIDLHFTNEVSKKVMLDSAGKASLTKIPFGPLRARQPKRR